VERLFVPAATPAPIVKKLEDTLRRVIADPDVNASSRRWR
jgi:tripartite-type tricarboxylate transporter receptor subunit TctC